MRRALITLLAFGLLAASCSGSSDDGLADYYAQVADVTTAYESAADSHFEVYRTALEAATEETGDDIYVTASRGLFAGLAPDLSQVVALLSSLEAPAEVEAEHTAWLASAQELNTAIQNTSDELSSLSEAPAVADVLATVNLVDLQNDYRSTCRAVRDLASESMRVIACEPSEAS